MLYRTDKKILINMNRFSPDPATWLPAPPRFLPAWSGRSCCKPPPPDPSPPAWLPALAGVAQPCRHKLKTFRKVPRNGQHYKSLA